MTETDPKPDPKPERKRCCIVLSSVMPMPTKEYRVVDEAEARAKYMKDCGIVRSSENFVVTWPDEDAKAEKSAATSPEEEGPGGSQQAPTPVAPPNTPEAKLEAAKAKMQAAPKRR